MLGGGESARPNNHSMLVKFTMHRCLKGGGGEINKERFKHAHRVLIVPSIMRSGGSYAQFGDWKRK